ncbi:toll-like receptor 4 [Physella acuta]|uniref:toll-like receptor 4 n=1 Tax=Physella acuta TaxID=109671 RepID=UPI0027DD0444|nr:toll-like receptor 4 [Physella acuta]
MNGVTRYGNQNAHFTQAGNVRHLYIVNNYVISGTGRVLGLSALTLFDLSGTFMDVQHYFFDDFPGLRILRLKSMRPENFFSRLSCDRLIANLPYLTYFDLSNNRLNRLPAGLFRRNPMMTHVILAKNRFSCLPFDLGNTPDLEYLDLSENAVTYLEQAEMEALTAHWQQTPNFRLRLGGNNIACMCSQIRFLGWLERSQFLIGRDLYTCTSQDGQRLKISDVIADLQGFYRHCYGSMYFMSSLVLLSLHLFTFLSAVLVLRFRTRLLAFICRLLFPARVLSADDYKYDVFLGYADDDFLFVHHQLSGFLEDSLKVRTFIHQRDLGPGYTDQQFFKAIRNSWRVMLVITDTFLHRYQLCDVVIKFASHSVTSLNPRRVLVLVEESQYQNIPDYLYDVIDETRIVVVKDLQRTLDYGQQQKIRDCIFS